jgi:hypothetical protein
MLVKEVLDVGGVIVPLMLPEGSEGGIMNPSIYNDNGRLLCNIRHVKYTIYQSRKYPHTYGPLQYIHAENDQSLRTINYVAELNDNLEITNYTQVNTTSFDTAPKWEFIGLEDARIFRWDKLYLCGVRRDTTTNGQGRMELSELDENFKEISRRRLPAPIDTSYCEKNWVPVLDQPYTFIKWTNPTEVVNVEHEVKTTILKNNYRELPRDLRGSSHVIPYKDKYIAIMHEVALYNSQQGQKDATYLHRFVVWNKEWDIEYIGEPFSFLGGEIEFCTGATLYKDSLLVSFGHHDNSAYILKIPLTKLDQLCHL